MMELQKAKLAIQRGDKTRARALLASLVLREPNNSQAWLLLADLLDDPKQVAYCWERARKIMQNAQPLTPSEKELADH